MYNPKYYNSKKRRDNYLKNKDKILKKNKEDRINNLEECREYDRKFYFYNAKKVKLKRRIYYLKNRELILEKQRKGREKRKIYDMD